MKSHGRHGEPDFSVFIEKRSLKQNLRYHNNTITLHILVTQKPI